MKAVSKCFILFVLSVVSTVAAQQKAQAMAGPVFTCCLHAWVSFGRSDFLPQDGGRLGLKAERLHFPLI